MAASKPTVAKLEVVKYENAHATNLAAKDRNEHFGFRCLHYSVSEACESVKIAVLNKSETACKIRVRTVDDQAKAGEDFEALDKVLTFAKGDKS